MPLAHTFILVLYLERESFRDAALLLLCWIVFVPLAHTFILVLYLERESFRDAALLLLCLDRFRAFGTHFHFGALFRT